MDKVHKNEKDLIEKEEKKKKETVLINDSFIHDIKLDGHEAQRIRDSRLDKRQIIHERI